MRKDCNKVITVIDALGHLLSRIIGVIGVSPDYSQSIKSTDTYALLCSTPSVSCDRWFKLYALNVEQQCDKFSRRSIGSEQQCDKLLL